MAVRAPSAPPGRQRGALHAPASRPRHLRRKPNCCTAAAAGEAAGSSGAAAIRQVSPSCTPNAPPPALPTAARAFVAVLLLGLLPLCFDLPLLGCWATLSVVLLCAPDAPVARLKALVLGHLLGGLSVVSCHAALGGLLPLVLVRATAFALAVWLMVRCDAVHPPAGALVFVFLESERLQALGPLFVLWPALPVSLSIYALAKLTRPVSRQLKDMA